MVPDTHRMHCHEVNHPNYNKTLWRSYSGMYRNKVKTSPPSISSALPAFSSLVINSTRARYVSVGRNDLDLYRLAYSWQSEMSSHQGCYGRIDQGYCYARIDQWLIKNWSRFDKCNNEICMGKALGKALANCTYFSHFSVTINHPCYPHRTLPLPTVCVSGQF